MESKALIIPKTTIIPLADVNLASLEKLFDEECAEWLELLNWDYKGASMLIRDVARQRQLSGFAAISGNDAIGFAYYLVEGSRCSIGDIFISRPWRGVGIDAELADAVFDKLDRQGRVRRVESQYVGVGNFEADKLFQARGFERLERNYMLLDLGLASKPDVDTAVTGSSVVEGSDISIRRWKQDDFPHAARVIHRSYRDTFDSRINSQYRTEQGCAELLTILTDHIWCGDFLPQVSHVAVRQSGAIAGLLIGSRVYRGVGHIGQISVHPAQQGRGIGRRLIVAALSAFRRRGFKSVTLAVTSANANALHLYESCGFRTIHTFPVFYREKT